MIFWLTKHQTHQNRAAVWRIWHVSDEKLPVALYREWRCLDFRHWKDNTFFILFCSAQVLQPQKPFSTGLSFEQRKKNNTRNVSVLVNACRLLNYFECILFFTPIFFCGVYISLAQDLVQNNSQGQQVRKNVSELHHVSLNFQCLCWFHYELGSNHFHALHAFSIYSAKKQRRTHLRSCLISVKGKGHQIFKRHYKYCLFFGFWKSIITISYGYSKTRIWRFVFTF